jgi:hypothetical protein
MKARPSDSRSALRPFREHVVEVTIKKDQIERKGFSSFPLLCACAVRPLPKLTDTSDSLSFRFHLEDWNNVVNDLLDKRNISFDNFYVHTEESDRAKGIQFRLV